MMKKINSALAALLLVATVALALSACSAGKDTDSANTDTTAANDVAATESPMTETPAAPSTPAAEMMGSWEARGPIGMSILFSENNLYSAEYQEPDASAQGFHLVKRAGTYTVTGDSVTLTGDVSATGTLNSARDQMTLTLDIGFYKGSATFRKMPNF